MEMVRCELAQMLTSDNVGDAQVAVLREVGGSRGLRLNIGFFEAASILMALSSPPPPRPMTYDLMAALVKHLGGRVTALEIVDLRDDFNVGGTYYGTLVLERDGEVFRVDCRPSDGISLALRTGGEIRVAEAVFAKLDAQS